MKDNGKCDQFARVLVKKLREVGILFDIIRVGSIGSDIIYSDKFKEAISYHGYHYGIKIGNTIYDNLTTTGMQFQNWIADLGGDAYIVWDSVYEILSH